MRNMVTGSNLASSNKNGLREHLKIHQKNLRQSTESSSVVVLTLGMDRNVLVRQPSKLSDRADPRSESNTRCRGGFGIQKRPCSVIRGSLG